MKPKITYMTDKTDKDLFKDPEWWNENSEEGFDYFVYNENDPKKSEFCFMKLDGVLYRHGNSPMTFKDLEGTVVHKSPDHNTEKTSKRIWSDKERDRILEVMDENSLIPDTERLYLKYKHYRRVL